MCTYPTNLVFQMQFGGQVIVALILFTDSSWFSASDM